MPLQNNQQLLYNSTLSKWTNDFSSLSDQKDVLLSTPSNGQVLSYNGTKWINNTTSSGSPTMSTDTTTTTLNLSSYSTNTYIDYTASSITVSNGPSSVNGTVLGGVTVKFETDGTFFKQDLYVNGVLYVRFGKLSSISTSTWNTVSSSSSASTSYTVIDALTTPPVNTTFIDQDTYYVLPSPTGVWSSITPGRLAIYNGNTSSWDVVTVSDGTVIILSIPTNLSILSSSYYFSGQSTIYNSLFTPVVTGVYLQPVTSNTINNVTSVSSLKFKKIIPLRHYDFNTWNNSYTLTPSGDLCCMFIDTQDRVWSKAISYGNGAWDPFINYPSRSFGLRQYPNNELVTVKQAYGASGHCWFLKSDKSLIYSSNVKSQRGGGNSNWTPVTVMRLKVFDTCALYETNVNSIYTDIGPGSSKGNYSYLLGQTTVTYPTISIYYVKTTGKLHYLGGNNGAIGDGTTAPVSSAITYSNVYAVTSGSNILTGSTTYGNAYIDIGMQIQAIASVIPSGCYVGSIINGNQVTMVDVNGNNVNALSTVASQSVTFLAVSTQVGILSVTAAITNGSTTVTLSASDVTLVSGLGYLYNPAFPNGRTSIVSVLSSTTIQVANASTVTNASITLYVDLFTNNIKTLLHATHCTPLTVILTNNNNVYMTGSTSNNVTATWVNYTSSFPNINTLMWIDACTPSENIGKQYSSVWYKTTTNTDALMTWGDHILGNGRGTNYTTVTTYGAVGTTSTTPVNILPAKTSTCNAVSSGASTITFQAALVGPISVGYYVSGTNIPTGTYVKDILSSTSISLCDVNGNTVTVTGAITAGTTITYQLLAPGESISNYKSGQIIWVTGNILIGLSRVLLTSTGRLFQWGPVPDASTATTRFYYAPTLIDRNVTKIFFDNFYSDISFLYLKTDGWLYLPSTLPWYPQAINNNALSTQDTVTGLTAFSISKAGNVTQPLKTYYNTTTYGPISDVVGGYVLTTDGTIWAMQANKVVNVLNSSIVM